MTAIDRTALLDDLGYVMSHVEAQSLTDPVPDKEIVKLRDYLVKKSHDWAKYRQPADTLLIEPQPAQAEVTP